MDACARFVVWTVVVLTNVVTWAGDWPQVLGPHRNGIAQDERITSTFPKTGPRLMWENRVGSGFAGPAVANGRVVLFHRLQQEDVVESLDADSGKGRWKRSFPARYVPSYTDDSGPRCVPLIHQGRVYLYGARGMLRCLDERTGEVIWSRDTFADYNSGRPFKGEPADGYFGIGTSPIVEADKLLVNVGGDTKQAGIVAFSLKDGRTVWTATEERASYSSPVAATIDGERHVVFATRFSVLSVDPQDGSVRFRFDFGRPGPNVTAANPLVLDGHLFITASYGFGAVFAKIEKTGAREIWANDDVLSSQYTTCIEHEGKLYGIHGRQDLGFAALRCFDPRTGRVDWSEDGFGYASLVKADNKLILLKTDGELVLAEPNAQRYRELARARVFDATTRALPALSNGLLYARDERTLKCLDLRVE